LTGASGKFLDLSAYFLSKELLPRVEGAVQQLSEEDLWWRPNEASNSVGNLLLHMAGNLRQWVVHGVGGEEDARVRNEEFSSRGGVSKTEALDLLRSAVADAGRTLARLDASTLASDLTIQGLSVSGMEAIYHAVEHFSMHAGQIFLLTKLKTEQDLGFYRVKDDGKVGRAW
jgi:uncharacterized damage-inducible protein DinB